MKTNVLLSLILAGSLISVAHADESTQSSNTSTVKATDVQKKDETQKDIDAEITNAKLRAESGSKSKWSVKADITYNGGNVQAPLGPVRPNYAGISSQDARSSISGTIAGAYRLSERDSLRLGTGVSLMTPFQGTLKDVTNSEEGRHNSDVSNPYLDYSRVWRSGNMQNVFDTSYSHYTQKFLVDAVKAIGTFDINHTVAWDFEGSGWSPGVNVDFNYSVFSDGKNADDVAANPEGGRTDYTVAVYPYVEYAFNDKYSFRTVFRFLTYDHYRSDAGATYYRELYTQSVGIGIAMTRDIYLYPNFQFAPEHMSPERTNVGLSTTLNIF